MGAVPVLARGLGYTAPTYSRRRPGSPSNGLLGSALLFKVRGAMTPEAALKAELRRAALTRRAALPASARALFSQKLITEGLALAAGHSAAAVSAFYPIR